MQENFLFIFSNPHQLMWTFVEEISNSYNHNLRISRFPELIHKIFLITFKLSHTDFSNTFFARANKIKQFN